MSEEKTLFPVQRQAGFSKNIFWTRNVKLSIRINFYKKMGELVNTFNSDLGNLGGYISAKGIYDDDVSCDFANGP